MHEVNCRLMSHSDDARIAWGWKEDGDDLFERGNFEEAIECYNKALELFPRDPDLWNVKGLALSKLERYDEAINLISDDMPPTSTIPHSVGRI